MALLPLPAAAAAAAVSSNSAGYGLVSASPAAFLRRESGGLSKRGGGAWTEVQFGSSLSSSSSGGCSTSSSSASRTTSRPVLVRAVVDNSQRQGQKQRARLAASKIETHVIKEAERPLAEYMSLPASQYSVLDAERIERVDESTFRCYAPRLKFFSFEVGPVLLVRVEEQQNGCCIRLLSFTLEGSPIVVAQNEKFTATMVNKVSWRDGEESHVEKQLVSDTTIEELGAGLFSSNREAVVKLALMLSVLGLHVCSGAWAAGAGAGIEVAQMNGNSGLDVGDLNVNSGLDLGDLSDIQSGFASAFLLIFFSEIGDKTFFIAALLATRKSSVAVFSGTFGALMAMSVISVFLGRAFHYIDGILPSFGLDTKLPVDDIAAVVLLVYFGVSTLLDAYDMDENGEEKQEAELAIADVGAGGAVAGTVAATFALVFVAEWGDKSFFSTIALAAASSPLGVVSGAIAGHGAATLLAVLGGSFLGNYVSERVIAYVGGALFLVFAGATLVEILN